jgi:hypothetical protein
MAVRAVGPGDRVPVGVVAGHGVAGGEVRCAAEVFAGQWPVGGPTVPSMVSAEGRPETGSTEAARDGRTAGALLRWRRACSGRLAG